MNKLLVIAIGLLAACASHPTAMADGERRDYDEAGDLLQIVHLTDGKLDGAGWNRLSDGSIELTEWSMDSLVSKDTIIPETPDAEVASQSTASRWADFGLARLPAEIRPVGQGAKAGFVSGYSDTKEALMAVPGFVSSIPEIAPNIPGVVVSALESFDPEEAAGKIPGWVKDQAVGFDNEMTDSMTNAGIPAEYEIRYKTGFVGGWMAWQTATAAVTAGAVKVAVSGATKLTERQAFRLAAEGSRNRHAISARLPQNAGAWKSGSAGNGLWKSEIREVNLVTRGKAIKFTKDAPDFSPWCRGGYKFKAGELNGTDADFPTVYQKVAQDKGLPSANAAREYLKRNGLTPHHLNTSEIQLIPTALHENIPHTGGASALRMAGK
jgi:hypothetical protein